VKRTKYLDEHVDLSCVVIESERPFPYQVDGDYLGETDRLELTHEPDAVNLVRPLPLSPR
jgi:diacylglycerol kinase family enzyme